MRVLMPGRILERHVGGNTTYARHLADGLRDRGITVESMPAGRTPPATLIRETLEGLQRGAHGDVLHYVADTGPLLRTRRPSVVTVHGVASRWITVARNTRQEKIWRTRVQRAVDSVDHVVTVSDSSARDVQEVFGVEAGRLTTVHHGIDVQRYAGPAEMSRSVSERLPERYVLYLGNIEPRKNLVSLIRAFDTPEVRALGVKLVIAGKPAWNADESTQAIELSSQVVPLGFVSDEDRAALMQRCDLFAFPSLYEGFGFPVLEALAAGAPVITSDRGSLDEVAGPSLRFASLEADGIAAGIAWAMTDSVARTACAAAGPGWAGRFSWARSVEQHVAVYDKVGAR